MPELIPALGVVLAGGRGLRVGGADKGLLLWQGRALVDWVLEALRPQVQAVALCVNRSHDRYARFGVPLISDADPQAFEGPLAGLLAALQAAEGAGLDWAWIVPCDAPLLPAELGAALWAARGQADTVLPRSADGRLQPGHALVHRRLLPPLQRWLAGSGDRSLGRWLLAQRSHTLAWPGELGNLNTLAAMAAADPR